MIATENQNRIAEILAEIISTKGLKQVALGPTRFWTKSGLSRWISPRP